MKVQIEFQAQRVGWNGYLINMSITIFSSFIFRHLWVAIFIMALTGCVSIVSKDDDTYVVESIDDVETNSREKIRPQATTSKAVLALLSQARRAALNGELTRSESFLERALRIEPRNAVLWHYMAKLRLNQARLKQAAGLAAKSNTLDSNNKTLQADNWRIIAHARHQSGDLAGAKRAQDKVDELSQP